MALLVRHLDARRADRRRRSSTPRPAASSRQLIGNCTITSLADIVAPTLAGPCLERRRCAAVHRRRPPRRPALRATARSRRPTLPGGPRAAAPARSRPRSLQPVRPQRGARLLRRDRPAGRSSSPRRSPPRSCSSRALVDAFYGAVKTLVTVDPNPEVQDGPAWFKVTISVSMLVALLFAAAFTGGLVERLIGRNLTGLVGRRAVPRSDHVVVVGPRAGRAAPVRCCCAHCGHPGRRRSTTSDDGRERRSRARARPAGRHRARGGPVAAAAAVAGPRDRARGGHRRRPAEHRASTIAARAESRPTCASCCAPARTPPRGETRSLERLGHVRDVHRIGAVYLAGLALGSAATHVVVDGDTAHLRDDRRRARALPVSRRGVSGARP